MTTEITTLGIEVDSTDVIKADDALLDMASSASRAADEVQDLTSKSKTAGTTLKTHTANATKASTATSGMGRSAGQAGIQIQQMVGQIQGGVSPMVALSQQAADLGIVLGAPLIGVAVSLGAVLVGTLAAAFMTTEEEASDLVDRIKEMTNDFENLTEAQANFLLLDYASKIEEAKDRQEELTEAIAEQQSEIELLEEKASGYGRTAKAAQETLNGTYAETQKSIASMSAEYDTLNQDIDAYKTGIEDIKEIMAGISDEDLAVTMTWPTQDEMNQRRFSLQSELDAINDYLEGEYLDRQLSIYNEFRYAMQDMETQRIADERDSFETQLGIYQEYANARIQADEDAANAAIELEQQKNEAMQNLTSAFTAFMAVENEEIFNIGKAGAASMALINAYGAAAKAWEQGGIYGAVSAAAVWAAAAANVSSILSTDYGDTSGTSSSTSISSSTSSSSSTSTDNSITNVNITGGNNISTSEWAQILASVFDSDAVPIKSTSAQFKRFN